MRDESLSIGTVSCGGKSGATRLQRCAGCDAHQSGTEM